MCVCLLVHIHACNALSNAQNIRGIAIHSQIARLLKPWSMLQDPLLAAQSAHANQLDVFYVYHFILLHIAQQTLHQVKDKNKLCYMLCQ